mgnify:CR=1 FL=1
MKNKDLKDIKNLVASKENNDDEISHAGHRNRMTEKIKKYGVKSLEAHEVLEYLLWFTIPRKDTNPLGHKLLKKFGSLANVLNADIKSLQSVTGIGERTALFLTSLPDVFDIYKESASLGKLDVLNDVSSCVRFFRSRFEIHKKEYLYIFCLNGKNKVVKYEQIEGENDLTINVNIKFFTDYINDDNTASVLICHTHPLGETKPSNEDLVLTERLMRICNVMHKTLIDHIIFNEMDHFSMGANHILDCMRLSVAFDMAPMQDKKLKSRTFTPFSYLDNSEETKIKITTWEKRYKDLLALKNLQDKCNKLETDTDNGNK